MKKFIEKFKTKKIKDKKLSGKKLALVISLSLIISVSAVLGICAACGAFTSELKKVSRKLSNYWVNASVTAAESGVSVSASQKIEYINRTGTDLNDICLHLYARAFREDATIKPYTNLTKASCFPNGDSYGDILIEKVNERGNSANFEFAGEDTDILKINLSSPLADGNKIELDMEYTVTLANCTHRLGYYKHLINLGNFYPIVCAYNEGWQANPYYSTGDPFVSDCANYSVNITCPVGYDCYASGSRVVEGNTYKFNALAVRDFAAIITSSGEAASSKVGNTNVTYVGYKGDGDIAENLEIAKKAVNFFNNKFGKYPYSSLVVAKSAFMQGGMEYPNFVTISDSVTEEEEYKKVIVHEIAHQWWYGMVGNNQIESAWLDESLAEYSTCLFFEEHGEYGIHYTELVRDATASYLIYVDVISSLSGKVNTSMNLPVNKYATEYEYTYMVYVKGVIMLDTLREVVGKNKLINALGDYFKEYKYKIADEQGFIKIMEKSTHKDLKAFFNGWLSGSNVIGYVE